MIRDRSRDMILIVSCGLLIFSVLDVMSQEDECSILFKNIAVYEGTTDLLFYFPTSPNNVEWSNSATYGEQDVPIVNYDDTLHPGYAADYAFDRSSGLTIRNMTTTTEPGHLLSTAGMYFAQCGSRINQYFKVLVVRQGPMCSCTPVNSSSVQLTCSSTYADSEYFSINAIFTLYVDGTNYATDTPSRANYDQYTYISTSTFTIINYASSSTYQCIHTFSQPTDYYEDLAMNAPDFNQQCSFVCTPETTTTTEATTTELTTTTDSATTDSTATDSTTTTTPTQPPASTTTLGSPPPGEDCSKTRQCQPEYGTGNFGIYIKSVVKAQLYTRSDKCCPNSQVCGVVVTLQYGSRYLIHDAVCNDNKLNMAVVAASCMSSDWKLISERSILLFNVGAFVLAGNIAQVGSTVIPCILSCNAMMSLL